MLKIETYRIVARPFGHPDPVVKMLLGEVLLAGNVKRPKAKGHAQILARVRVDRRKQHAPEGEGLCGDESTRKNPQYCAHAIQAKADQRSDRTVVNPEVQFLASVVVGDAAPAIIRRTRPEGMGEDRLGFIHDLAVAAQPKAQFGILTVEKEALVKLLEWAHHQTSTHHLLNLTTLRQPTTFPIRTKPRRPGENALKKCLLTKHGPQRQPPTCRFLETPILKLEPTTCGDNVRVIKHFGKLRNRTRFRLCVAVKQQHQSVLRNGDTLVARDAEPDIVRIPNNHRVGTGCSHPIWRSVDRCIVYDDHLMSWFDGADTLDQKIGCVVAHDDDRHRREQRANRFRHASMLQFTFMSEHVLTQAAFEKLKLELEDLKGPTRLRVAEAIREAKSHGDLRENAAYHEAKLNQSRLESRIADLEKLLQIAKVVDGVPANADIADLGSKVRLLDLEWDEEMEITLVSSYEADPANDMISISSPLGAGIVGQSVGGEFEIEAPAGTQRYRILGIG